MKTRIRNIDDLRAERARLKNEVQLTKTSMRDSINVIKDDLSPARHALDFLGNFMTNRHNGLLNIGVGIGVDTIVRNGILRRSPWPLRVLVPFFLKNFAGNMIHKNRDAIVAKGLHMVKNMTDDNPVMTEVNGVYIEDRPSLVEKALIWVKDITEEKPGIPAEKVKQENKPSFVERALMWVKDVTDEKPRAPQATTHAGTHVAATPVTVLSE